VHVQLSAEEVQKQEHSYGSTQVELDPTSTASIQLNIARAAIKESDLMDPGKDVDPNHVTVRYGLVDDEHDRLRAFIASQRPFQAEVTQVQLFPASEHSGGAVPVVARIGSPHFHTIEQQIGNYAAFKDKNFPVYVPHCTLAYCKPEAAQKYANLIVGGIFTVSSITISHASGVKETIPFGIANKWDATEQVRKADPVSGRYVTPFVSFDKQGDEQLRMIASLNSSRLATWGFTAEAEVVGMARYRLTAVLDGRTSRFCRFISGKVFEVTDAREKVIEALNVQDPNDLRVVQPWPKQTNAAMAGFMEMSNEELVARGLHIPPYHPHCRTLCRSIEGSKGKTTEVTPTVPAEAEVFQAVTAADLAEMGIEATPENVAQWNAHIGMSPTELLSKLTGMPPQEVMTKGQGVGATPIRFEEDGNIALKARGEDPKGVEFKLGALLDPFTGIFYLTQAELVAGTPKAELAFLKNLFTELINVGVKSSATELAVGVAGNAAYFAKLGFLPDEIDWDAIRLFAQAEIEEGELKAAVAALAPADQLLIRQLLQDKSPSALTALVELPFVYEGKTIGEWILGETSGTWALDLADEAMMAQAKAYLS
jgi:2'-5' RNA ligase